MKCPKCGYLGFEDVDRCRNCGYDFSLLSATALPELPLRGDRDDVGPLDELALVDAAAAASYPAAFAKSSAFMTARARACFAFHCRIRMLWILPPRNSGNVGAAPDTRRCRHPGASR